MRTDHASVISRLPFAYLILALGTGALGGCATESLTPSTPPTPLRNLGLSAQGPHAAVEVIDIIQPGGTGSWSPNARWTEIVVRITNSSTSHLVGREISLVSVTGASLPAVESPLVLADTQQHLARSTEQADATSKLTTQALSSASKLAPAVSPSSSSRVEPIVSSMQQLADAFHQQKMRSLATRAPDIEAEVRRRGLAPRARLSPGDHVQGSVFFALTPSPKKLVVAYEASAAVHFVEVMLVQGGKDQGKPPEATAPSPAPPPASTTPPLTTISALTTPPGPSTPAAASSGGRPAVADLLYTVKAGDTLGAIAARLTGSVDNWRRIAEYNGIASPAALRPGTLVKIPNNLIKDPSLPR